MLGFQNEIRRKKNENKENGKFLFDQMELKIVEQNMYKLIFHLISTN